MSTHEAQEYVDIVIEKLHEFGIIPEANYGRILEEQRQLLAELVAEKSEE